MEIKYVKRTDIDIVKWNEAVLKSICPLVYAQSAYLDAMSSGWDAVIVGDYEAVMPVTKKRKYGITYLCQPAFAQQLGIFSKNPLSESIQNSILFELQKRYKLIEIQFNYTNFFVGGLKRINFILDLKLSYNELVLGYKKDLKNNLLKAFKNNLKYNISIDTDFALRSYQQFYKDKFVLPSQDWENFKNVTAIMLKQNKAFVRQVTDSNNNTLAVALFLDDSKRIYNVASTIFVEGRKKAAGHFLFDRLLHEFAGRNIILDFEGSELPGVASFYKLFNPIEQPYFFYQYNRLPLIVRKIKSIIRS